ncbi:MAG: DUF58 domain-containing protein [Reichenbachiella sp.]|uniref:DUF58 domain-containing protein n=1 Tax=Reichenbachiella sp. TaxID=2184521 RepID=UPI003263D027
MAFILGFPYPIMFPVAKILLITFVGMIAWDIRLLFNSKVRLEVNRDLPNVMSLGNINVIKTTILNDSNIPLGISFYNQLPYQFQLRESAKELHLQPGSSQTVKHELRPIVRGEYEFGHTILYVRSWMSLLERRIVIDNEMRVPVYPSVMDVKKFDLMAMRNMSQYYGVKQIRRLGQSYEFEQISEYSIGDDYQSINWKATGRSNRLMVNKFTDEKAQPVYCFIDKSRSMKMPFNGLSLLDYAINTSLIIANTALTKDDKAGLLTFSDRIETFVNADRRKTQFRKILHSLYNEKETKIEANYELLYAKVRQMINGRSLIFLYSNFDSIYALERVLPVLRKLNKMHLLVVVVFQNTELEEYWANSAKDVLDIYNHTIAQKYITEKKKVIMSLQQYGLQVIYSRPEDLSINSINKYLELKSRGMI